MNELRIGSDQFDDLRGHLLREDHDEHGAALLAGHSAGPAGSTLVVREVHLLDDIDFPPGVHGYRQFAPAALARLGNRALDERLSLVTIHSHPGALERNSLSADDLSAHERVFPHLLDITGSSVVGGIALGQRSVAGELWTSDGHRAPLDLLRVVGTTIEYLRPAPIIAGVADERFDRQVRMFGAVGQTTLREMHVAVVGAGGGGSILIEQLAHLGIGRITAVDFDVVKRHNLSRIMGATAKDAKRKTKKVRVARRVVRSIDPSIHFQAVDGDIRDLETASQLLQADWIFLATDTATARLVANAVAQSFLIPTVQIGARVEARADGSIEQVYTAVRPILPGRGCLACAGLIDPAALQREAATPQERENQNYLGDFDEIIDPSVTTLNAAAAAGALNVMLMAVTGLASDDLMSHRLTLTREGSSLTLQPQRDSECRWCGSSSKSRFGRADISLLPCRAPMTSNGSSESVVARFQRLLSRSS